MELSQVDLARIHQWMGEHTNVDDFSIEVNGMRILQNHNGHCIFLDPRNKTCTIYDIRPVGCQFYPLIFDVERNRCVLDAVCPKRSQFYPGNAIRPRCAKLRKFVREELLRSADGHREV
jgi:Fe-S-cluster containining protein